MGVRGPTEYGLWRGKKKQAEDQNLVGLFQIHAAIAALFDYHSTLRLKFPRCESQDVNVLRKCSAAKCLGNGTGAALVRETGEQECFSITSTVECFSIL